MKHIRKRSLAYLIIIIALYTLSGCNASTNTQQVNELPRTGQHQEQQPPLGSATTSSSNPHKQTRTNTQSQVHLQSNESSNTAPYSHSATLLAVGDVMMHSTQFPSYYNKQSGTYNFRPFFTQVKPILEKGDWIWANLETPLLGGERVYTGYPMFNAPPELADALKYAGFNIVTTANNHALDRREKGAIRTLEVLKKRGLVTKGTSASKWESEQATIVEKNGIKLGILAYTYGTNGIPLPKKKPYIVSLIDEQRMIKDIQKTKQAGADAIAIALHFGPEYKTKPTNEQVKLARKLVQAGADIILGAHPHVLQPYEQITVKEADGSTREAIIMYSLGNFISGQKGNGKDVGVIFGVEIVKHMPENRIELRKITSEPTWVHISGTRNKRKYRIIPMTAAVTARNDKQLSAAHYNQLGSMLNNTKKHLKSMAAVPITVNVLE
ncbi:CapA family protein [Paenibacillus sp. 481]|uniref:CapA family protein n=1 Tax=Paenibacillus sp. 481 TaxID=2835869 RepID=UPI001E3D0607|nr:CapA family protein [Paenibacillus sp. 481]UHA73039.1 CapA family protein [Paenibacillus sp. 481]